MNIEPLWLDRVTCQETQQSAALNSVCLSCSHGAEACFLPQLSNAKSVSTNYTPLLVTTSFMAPGRATSTSAGVSMWQKYKSLLFTTDTVHNYIHPEQHILAAPLFFNPQWFSLWIAVSHDMPQFANTVQGDVRNVATVTCKVSIHEIMSAGLSRRCPVLGLCFGLS